MRLLSPALGRTPPGLDLQQLGMASVREVSSPKVKWGKQVQSGVRSGEADSGGVPVNIHGNGERVEAKARPFARRCRPVRSGGTPATALGQGHVPSRPRHSVSISLSHCPRSGREPLCWHGAFQGSSLTRGTKGRYQHGSTALPPKGRWVWTHPPSLIFGEPPETPGSGWGCCPLISIKNFL